MPGLVLEGGTFRPVFSCGVMDALLDHDIMFDYVVGVSAGITYAISYLSRQRGRNLEVLRRYRGDSRYFGVRNLPHDHSIFGTDFVFDTIPNQLIPFDWETYHRYKGRILVGVTNAETGRAEYLDGAKLDRTCTMLRATCAIPLYFPAVQLGGGTFYDGGVADPIPIVRSLHDGNRKNLIVLTQPKSYPDARLEIRRPCAAPQIPGHDRNHARASRPLQRHGLPVPPSRGGKPGGHGPAPAGRAPRHLRKRY